MIHRQRDLTHVLHRPVELTALSRHQQFQTIDISDFAVERVLDNNARPEAYVL